MSERMSTAVKLLLLAGALLVLGYFLAAVIRVVLLFLLILVLAMMLTPPVSWLERARLDPTPPPAHRALCDGAAHAARGGGLQDAPAPQAPNANTLEA